MEDGSGPLNSLKEIVGDITGGPKRQFTPLYVIFGIVAIADLLMLFALRFTAGPVDWMLSAGMILNSLIGLIGIIYLLVTRPFNMYSPGDWENTKNPKGLVDAVLSPFKAETTTHSSIEAVYRSTEASDQGETIEVIEISAEVLETTTETEQTDAEQAFYRAAIAKPFNADEFDRSYMRLAEEDPESAEREARHEAYLFIKASRGDQTALSELEALLASKAPGSLEHAKIARHVARVYAGLGSFEKSLGVAAKAISDAPDSADLTDLYLTLATAYFRTGCPGQGIETLRSALSRTSIPDNRRQLYLRLAEHYEEIDREDLRALAFEMSLAEVPSDTSARFRAAYSYSHSGDRLLAHWHYKRLLYIEEDNWTAKNNLAVLFGQYDLSVLAADLYRDAMTNGNDLARSNYAILHTDVGLVDDAKAILEEAVIRGATHTNIYSSLDTANSMREQQTEKEAQLYKQARDSHNSISDYARATLFFGDEADPINAGVWLTPENVAVAIEEQNERLNFEWLQNDRKYILKLKQTRPGMRVTSYEWKYPTLNYGGEKLASKGYAYLSESRQELKVVLYQEEEVSFLEFHRDETHGAIS